MSIEHESIKEEMDNLVNVMEEEEETYIVDLGSVYISKSEYKTITSWYDFLLEQAKNGNIEVDQVLTDDGMYPEDEELGWLNVISVKTRYLMMFHLGIMVGVFQCVMTAYLMMTRSKNNG